MFENLQGFITKGNQGLVHDSGKLNFVGNRTGQAERYTANRRNKVNHVISGREQERGQRKNQMGTKGKTERERRARKEEIHGSGETSGETNEKGKREGRKEKEDDSENRGRKKERGRGKI